MLILQALGEEPPLYAHVPLLHGPDGKKLSKRHGAASVQELRERGYLPEAVRNYVALLGWGNEESQEFFTTEQLQREFSLERVSKSPAVFDEQKLRHINGRYLRELGLDDLTARLEALTGREGLRGAAEISQEKISTLADFWPLAGFFFDGPADDPAAREKILGTPEALERLAKARDALAAVEEPWTEEALETALQSVLEETGREAAAGLPADPRRARRRHRLTGDLRDAEAARARRVARADRRGPQPYVHRCRYRLKAGHARFRPT